MYCKSMRSDRTWLCYTVLPWIAFSHFYLLVSILPIWKQLSVTFTHAWTSSRCKKWNEVTAHSSSTYISFRLTFLFHWFPSTPFVRPSYVHSFTPAVCPSLLTGRAKHCKIHMMSCRNVDLRKVVTFLSFFLCPFSEKHEHVGCCWVVAVVIIFFLLFKILFSVQSPTPKMSSMWNGSDDVRDRSRAGCRYFKPGARGQERNILEEPNIQFELQSMKSFSPKCYTWIMPSIMTNKDCCMLFQHILLEDQNQ